MVPRPIELTLQKSIDFTPLLPSAGPTGGLGLACPAPTMSFTTTSVAERALDMVLCDGVFAGVCEVVVVV